MNICQHLRENIECEIQQILSCQLSNLVEVNSAKFKQSHMLWNIQKSFLEKRTTLMNICQHLRENVGWDIWTTLSANSPIWLVEYAKFKQPKMLFNIFETGRVNLVCGICQIQTTKDVCPFFRGLRPLQWYWWWWWDSTKVFLLHMYVDAKKRCFCYICMWTRLMGDGGCFGLLLSRSPPSSLPTPIYIVYIV